MINKQSKRQAKTSVDSHLGEIDYELTEQELRQINGGNVVWGGTQNPPPPKKSDETKAFPLENDG
jgi:bacteriocin-like protein